MKNSKKLLLAAAFVATMPSAQLLCEDESIEPVIKAVVMEQTTEPEAISTQAKVAAAITSATAAIIKNKVDLMSFSICLGQFGFAAGAMGSHSLKTAKKNLNNIDTDIRTEIYAQLNKGIKNNRRLMAVSCAAMLPIHIYAINEISNGRVPKLTVVRVG